MCNVFICFFFFKVNSQLGPQLFFYAFEVKPFRGQKTHANDRISRFTVIYLPKEIQIRIYDPDGIPL